MPYPLVTIVMTTYFPPKDLVRKATALTAGISWRQHLKYYSGKINLHIADDGSENPVTQGWDATTFSQQNRQGYGASMNVGFAKAFESSPLVLHAVDDWAVESDFDITPWVKLLIEREDVGMVRLGPPHPNTSGTIQMLTDDWQGWGLVMDRKGFAFGTRPALYHKRFIDAYGWFTERVSALECERIYNEKFCSTPGPDIVLALPHPWMHLDSPSLSGLEPK